MRRVTILIGLLFGLLPLGLASKVVADEESAYRICVVSNERVMGLSNAESYCGRLQAEARARREAAGVSTPAGVTVPADEEAQYRVCVINNGHVMGSTMAESYCSQLRAEARERRGATGR